MPNYELPEFSNPFETLGLSKEIVSSILKTNDPEAMTETIKGFHRVISRVLHPDMQSGQNQSGDVGTFIEVQSSVDELLEMDPGDVLILARGFANTRGKRTTKVQASNKRLPTYSLINEFIENDYKDLAPTFNPKSRIFVHKDSYKGSDNAHWSTIRRSENDTLLVSHYGSELLFEDDENQLDENKLNTLISLMPWDEIIELTGGQLLSEEVSDFTTRLEIKRDGTFVILDLNGNDNITDLSELSESGLLNKPGIYTIESSLSKTDDGRPIISKAKIDKRFYINYSENEEELDARLIGTLDRRARQLVYKDEYVNLYGTKERLSIAGRVGNRALSYYGIPIPKTKLLSLEKYFDLKIHKNSLLVIASDQDAFVYNTIQDIF